MSSKSLARKSVGALVAPVLALSTLAALPSAPAHAAPGATTDPVPAANGAAWLAGQLDGERFPGPFGFGLTIDAVLGLNEIDGYGDVVATVTQSVADDVDEYIDYSYEWPEGEFHTGTSGGATAKSLVLATQVGVEPTSFGGRDLVAELEELVSTAAGSEGRVLSTLDGQADDSYTNTIIQALAVQGLGSAGSVALPRATDYLLAQQCPSGYFWEGPDTPGNGDQACESDAAAPSVDSTALALMALSEVPDSAAVIAARAKAVEWMLGSQGADGSWSGNANSTGLAGWALGEEMSQEAQESARDAAVWLRGRQADDMGPCTTGLTSETGAVAYDGAGLTAGRSDGIDGLLDQFQRSTSQALPALLSAPAGTYTGTATGDNDDFVQAASTQIITVDTLAPGQTVCFSRGRVKDLVNADADGTAVGTVVLPKRSGKRTFEVTLTDGIHDTITFASLKGKKFKAGLKSKKLVAGEKQRIVVRGFAKGESLTVRYQGRAVDRAVGKGKKFVSRFEVVRTKGKQRVQVFGEFGNRKVTKKFRVTRR